VSFAFYAIAFAIICVGERNQFVTDPCITEVTEVDVLKL
jgi:hypothetical protein